LQTKKFQPRINADNADKTEKKILKSAFFREIRGYTLKQMKKLLLTICAVFFLSLSVSAQSGTGSLKGFVASDIKNGSAIDATVELRAIKNWSRTKSVETTETNGGYYEIQVSFGYYLLTISAKGYETYQTKVLIPSSSTLEWGTILEKDKPRKGKKSK
jgi:hypothetical protein